MKIDNLNCGVVKQNGIKQSNKNIKNDLDTSNFKDSFNESINFQDQDYQNIKQKIELKNDIETLYDSLDETDKQSLQVILSILNVLGSEEISAHGNFFEFNEGFAIGENEESNGVECDNTKFHNSNLINSKLISDMTRVEVSDNRTENLTSTDFELSELNKSAIEFSDYTLKNEKVQNKKLSDIDLNNGRQDVMKSILIEMGFDSNKIDAMDISNQEIIQKVMGNIEGFKSLVKNEFDKIGENNFGNQLLEEANFDGFLLEDKELIRNIENEINIKLNTKLNTEISIDYSKDSNKIIDKKFESISHFKSVSEMGKIGDKINNDDAILKEISGDVQTNKNIDNYFVNVFRNNSEEIQNMNPNKILDSSNHQKFVKEFIENIEYMSSNNKNQMIVKLNPDHLGKMDIKYEVVKDSIRLMIKVENQDAIRLMETTISDIRNMIKEVHNINLENIQVDLQEFGFNSNDGRGNKESNNPNSSTSKTSTIKIEDEGINNDDNRDLRKGILV